MGYEEEKGGGGGGIKGVLEDYRGVRGGARGGGG